mmetsp:Transcript_64411/g.122077  ORF Transcript_64411/g.122077 Transcript_64411/m.122077 type:complete len:207 (+) Transcript_64411:244-864(+)
MLHVCVQLRDGLNARGIGHTPFPLRWRQTRDLRMSARFQDYATSELHRESRVRAGPCEATAPQGRAGLGGLVAACPLAGGSWHPVAAQTVVWHLWPLPAPVAGAHLLHSAWLIWCCRGVKHAAQEPQWSRRVMPMRLLLTLLGYHGCRKMWKELLHSEKQMAGHRHHLCQLMSCGIWMAPDQPYRDDRQPLRLAMLNLRPLNGMGA